MTGVVDPSTARSGRGSGSFTPEAERAIHRAQSAVLGLLDSAGLRGGRAVDLSRELGLDKTLAWKLSRFAEDHDPCSAFKHLPGPGGMDIAVRAAEAAGVPASDLEAVRAADRALRGFVRRHAGDRRSFEAMLGGAHRDPRAEAEEWRAFYQAGSTIWGVRAEAQLLTLALAPSETDPAKLDVVQLSGFVGLERLRADVPWVVRRLRVHEDDGRLSEPFEREALDAAGVPAGAGGGARPLSLMTEFCSRPLPEIRQRSGENGWLYDELSAGGVGRPSAVTVIAGERYRAALPRHRSAGNTEGRYVLTVRTPVERVQFDLLLHPALESFRWPTCGVIGGLQEHGVPGGEGRGRDLRPWSPAETLASSSVRSYESLLRRGFELAGWGDPGSFRGYRVGVGYPPAPCEVVMRSELAG